MKKKEPIKREHIWLGLMLATPFTAFSAVWHPTLAILAVIFLIIGLRGVMYDML